MARTYASYSSVASGRTLLNPLLVSHCELYLSSVLGMGAYANGASVTSWPDQTANSRHAVSQGGFTQPVYSTALADLTPLGRAVVKWAGVLNALGSSAFAWPSIGTRGYTFHWYGLTQAKSAPPYDFTNQVLWDSATTDRPAVLVHSGDGSGKYGFIDDAGGGAPKVFGSHASIADQWHLHSLVLPLPDNNTVPCRYYLDGVLQTQTGGATNYQCATPAGTDGYLLGQGQSGNVTFKGRTGFFLWYSDTHLQATIDSFKHWVDVFWGL